MTGSERLAQLSRGENPRLIHSMPSGFAVMGDFQYLPGYCLLLAYPEALQLNDLTGDARLAFLNDMAHLGDAVRAATGCLRINYSIYGNLDPFLHAHVWPRYEWEPEETKRVPPLSIPASVREADVTAYDAAQHDSLRDQIAVHLRS